MRALSTYPVVSGFIVGARVEVDGGGGGRCAAGFAVAAECGGDGGEEDLGFGEAGVEEGAELRTRWGGW